MGVSTYDRIYALVQEVPHGQVATYGQIAKWAGCSARQVGYAMAAITSDQLPWHRVINSRGMVSQRSDGQEDPEQYLLLKAEGVSFDQKGRTDLSLYQWSGPSMHWWAQQDWDPPQYT